MENVDGGSNKKKESIGKCFGWLKRNKRGVEGCGVGQNGKKCWRWRWVEMYKKERAENGGGSKRNEKEYGGGTGRDVQGREC